MKLIAARELDPSNAALVARWFVEVRRAHGVYAFTALVSYFFHADPNERMIDAIAKELPTTMRASMMSIAQKLEARGHERGKVEGQREGQAALILRLLSQRFGALPLRVTRRVRGGTLAELDRWSERLLGAAALDEVFAADD